MQKIWDIKWCFKKYTSLHLIFILIAASVFLNIHIDYYEEIHTQSTICDFNSEIKKFEENKVDDFDSASELPLFWFNIEYELVSSISIFCH